MSTRKQKANLSVYGFIRQYCKTSTEIPIDIIKLCMSFYLNQMMFYQPAQITNLEFNDEENIATCIRNRPKKNEQYHGELSFLFGVPISAQDCDIFYIVFKWMKSNARGRLPIMMGWITDQIKKSMGISIKPGQTNFTLYNKETKAFSKLENKVAMKHRAREGDEFKLTFDFKNDKVLVYHENLLITETSLEGSKVIRPKILLFYKGQKIKVVEWQFCKGNDVWS